MERAQPGAGGKGEGGRVVESGEEGFAVGGGVQQHRVVHGGLVEQARRRALGGGDPDEGVAGGGGEADEFARLAGEVVQDGLHQVRQAAGVEDALAQQGETEGEGVGAVGAVLFHPADGAHLAQQAVGGAFRQVEGLGDGGHAAWARGGGHEADHVAQRWRSDLTTRIVSRTSFHQEHGVKPGPGETIDSSEFRIMRPLVGIVGFLLRCGKAACRLIAHQGLYLAGAQRDRGEHRRALAGAALCGAVHLAADGAGVPGGGCGGRVDRAGHRVQPGVQGFAYPLLVFLQIVPKIAVAPLFIIWFGFGLTPKVLLVFLLSFFPIVVAAITAFQSIEPEIIELVRSTGAPRWRVFRMVQLPHALPALFGGFKVAAALAATAAVVAEFVASDRGLGFC